MALRAWIIMQIGTAIWMLRHFSDEQSVVAGSCLRSPSHDSEGIDRRLSAKSEMTSVPSMATCGHARGARRYERDMSFSELRSCDRMLRTVVTEDV